jgi:ArsR family transcriptional regulator
MEKIDKIVDIFKALSDPTRLKLVKLLNDCQSGICNGGPLCVNALAHQLGITQSAVSQHLRILRQAGLVVGEREGTFMHYSIDPQGLENYKTAIRQTLGEDFAP